ncbi:MAG TPA: hypothetical protein VMW53_08540 [archaeon]|nr:hypothetical protein [archaeon]
MKKQMRHAENAQSEVVGYSLLLGVLVIGVGIVILLAAPIIQESKNDAYLKNVEQGFTVLDSKVSMVGLGNSPSQLVQIYTQAGEIVIDDDTYSRISVIFYNWSDPIEVYNSSMGTVEYTLGQDKIAYEGGGTFRKYPGDDNVIMITPPEFHYNGETLTLPIIKINSNQSIGGSGVVNLYFQSDNTPNVLFPNRSENPEFKNPLLIGKQVEVVIKSDYYRAWAKYIEERTDAQVSTYGENKKEVHVLLNARPNDQAQDLNPPMEVYGFNTTNESALKQFNITIGDVKNNLNMDFTTSTSKTLPYLTFNTKKEGGLGLAGITIELNYYDTSGVETWNWDVQGIKIDIGGEDYSVEADYLDDYDGIDYSSGNPSWTWINETPPYNTIYNSGDSGPNGRKIFQHYMSLVSPNFNFYPGDKFDGFDVDESSYVLFYDVNPPHITYLHIVEHKIQATLA